MLGCGNSTLSEDVRFIFTFYSPNSVMNQMYDDGYKNIVNVDVRAPVLISLTGRTLADDWPGTSSIRPS
jgi:hypothetical protein